MTLHDDAEPLDDESWMAGSDLPGQQRLSVEAERRGLGPSGLDAAALRAFYERLWRDVCHLRNRYFLPVRTRWWSDPLQREAMAALAAWVERYDSGEWDDPPGKLALLFELERISVLLRDGNDPFDPPRDREGFERYLDDVGIPRAE